MAEENTNVTQGTEGQQAGTQPKTYTQEEVDKLIQSEADKRVTQALKSAEQKNAAKVKEAEKLAKMNESQKYEYELEQREKAIAEKEKALALAENKNEASKILAEKGISLELVDFVVAEEADTMNERIKVLDKAFKASVKAEVEKRMKSSAPEKNLALPGSITKDQFSKMSLMDKQKLFENNPELYNSLK